MKRKQHHHIFKNRKTGQTEKQKNGQFHKKKKNYSFMHKIIQF